MIYNGEVEASKIPNEWYSWMHYMNNKIENDHNLKKYDWQKEHLPNQTGSENSYHPKKYNNANKKLTIPAFIFFFNNIVILFGMIRIFRSCLVGQVFFLPIIFF